MKKRVLSLVLALVLVVVGLPLSASAAEIVASGYCGGEGDGTNLTWTLDDEGTLTISGTGEMGDAHGADSVLWYEFCSSIRIIIINYGVTSIGYRAFAYCTGLTSVTIPNSVTSIENAAFYYCSRGAAD